MSRAQTLVLALLAMHLLLGALCLAISRGEHKSPALRWWGWGLLAYSAGLLATMSAALGLPRPLVLVAGNGLIALSAIASAGGVLLHTTVRYDRRWVAAGFAATLAALAAANVSGRETLLVNSAAPTVLAAAVFLFAAATVARRGPRDARAASRVLAGILAFAVLTWAARIAALLAVVGGPQAPERVDLVVSLFAILQMVNGVAATLALVWIDVRIMQAELSRVAHTDALTGLPNRREARRRFDEEASRAVRHGQRFAFVLFDLDHFKQVNDEHGHAAGDLALQGVARVLGAAKRTEDVLARIGGEEFLVLLGQQGRQGALEAAERMRAALAASPLAIGGHARRMTMSGGIAFYPDDGVDWEALFATADRRLYAAKRAGRNRVAAGERAEPAIEHG